ncbi:nitrate- and nitrite sensing domain-containing protein [Umezawaea beigongshangensis]|uniref:nitrate- and nitrite sensing domain-containing protein n=1 Tax=Umezawaea beigongshangensis TaxID=2780383 RepID=UPI0027DAF85A|nr:nitrate- and nitrite sensing domain-containing protein [Umezawaea beigongshangensis]
MLLVPALSTLALAGLRLETQLDDVGTFDRVQRELQLSAQAAKVEDALQLERNAAVAYVAGGRSSNSGEHAARVAKSDAEVGRYREVAEVLSGTNSAVRESYRKSLQSLDGLTSLRTTLLTSKYPYQSVISAYNQVLGVLSQVHRATVSSLSDSDITPLALSAQALYSAKEQMGQQNAILIGAARTGSFAPGQADALRAAQSRVDAALVDYGDVTSQANRQLYQDRVSGGSVDGRNAFITLSLVQDAAGDEVAANDTEVMRVGEETTGLLRGVADDVERQADAAAVAAIDQARTDAWRDAALVALALVLAFGLMAVVARSMILPLRLLRRTALDVARVHLPEAIKRIRTHRDPNRAAEESVVPVPVDTTEEFGQVARAFDAVQREAVRLAVEQVALRANVNDMFINLSRRSQALVERQITVIDRLEQDEQDPDQLASLFELDHLATQMRRNSENLLVLSGTTVTRRVTRPVPIAEVLGAAVSEVEKYARVQIAPAPELQVQGRVVNDLAHLIAELLDNATAFSKPTTKVTVRAVETRRGEVSIRIHDRGVGMQESDVVEANHRLAEPPEVDVSVAREMGLYVVGQLAKRHDITVSLSNNDDIEGGVTAQVVLPAVLLHRGAAPLPAPAREQRASELARRPAPAEETGAGVISGLPKWNPDSAVSSGTFPPVFGTAEEDGGSHHLVEESDPSGLFTALEPVESSPLPVRGGAPDYSYPPAEEVDHSYTPGGHTGSMASLSSTTRQIPRTEVVPEPRPDPATERLPIYEDVLSRWFQSGAAGAGGTTPPGAPQHGAPVDGAGSARAASNGHTGQHAVITEPVADAPRVPPVPRSVAPLPAKPPAAKPVDTPAPRPAAGGAADWSTADWGTADWGTADDGWNAAAKALKTETEDKTTAGLPKRTPKARLIPGALPSPSSTSPSSTSSSSAATPSGGVATATAPVAPIVARGRSADALRQRFATYQRGVQMGRSSLEDSAAGDLPLFPESHRETQKEQG